MVIGSLSHRDVRFGIKNGFTFTDFCHKYNCTQAEFEDRIRGIYRYDSKKMLDSIRANAKRKGRQSRPETSNTAPTTNRTVEPPINNSETTATSTLPNPQSQLKILRQQEQALSDEVIRLESKHKAIAQQHRGHIRELRDLHTELETLRQTFEEKVTAYEAIASHNNELVTLMNQISQERNQRAGALADLRQQIKSLTEVVICAYDNGTIEPMDYDGNITLNETGSDALFSTLRDREDLEELRVKDIKILSRVLAIINNSEMRIIPMFENAALDSCFQAFNNPPQHGYNTCSATSLNSPPSPHRPTRGGFYYAFLSHRDPPRRDHIAQNF